MEKINNSIKINSTDKSFKIKQSDKVNKVKSIKLYKNKKNVPGYLNETISSSNKKRVNNLENTNNKINNNSYIKTAPSKYFRTNLGSRNHSFYKKTMYKKGCDDPYGHFEDDDIGYDPFGHFQDESCGHFQVK